MSWLIDWGAHEVLFNMENVFHTNVNDCWFYMGFSPRGELNGRVDIYLFQRSDSIVTIFVRFTLFLIFRLFV